MYTTEYSCYGLRPLHARRLTFLISFSLVSLVFLGVNLYLGSRLPKGLKGSDPYFLMAALLLGAWAVVIYFRRRFRIVVYGDEKSLRLEIHDPDEELLQINSPLRMSRQWIRRKNGETHVKELFLTFMSDNGAPLLTLKSSLGDLMEVPSRFDYMDMNSADRYLLKLSDRLYHTRVKDIEDMLNIHLTYLGGKSGASAYNLPTAGKP